MLRTSAGKIKHIANKPVKLCSKCGKYYEGEVCPRCETEIAEHKHVSRKSSK